MSDKLVRVTDLDYKDNDGEVVVRVVGRDEDGERNLTIIGGTEPYCFVPPHESADQDCVVREEHGYEGYDGRPLKKVVTKLPKNVGQIRDDFSVTYEADIPFSRRVSVDYGLSGYIRVPDRKHCDISEVETDIEESDVESITPRVVMADIEALPDYDVGFDEFTEEATGEVIMISAYDTREEQYDVFVLDPDRSVDGKDVKHHLGDHWNGHELAPDYVNADIDLTIADSESALLNAFLSYIEDVRPDLLSGWNWEDFDHRYLLNRMEKVDGVDRWRMSDIGGITHNYRNDLETTVARIDGLPGFDMMRAYCDQMVFSDWRSKSLDYVSQEELGVGKVEDINIHDGYEKDRSRLTAYNIIDTQLLVALDDMADIHGFFYQLSDLTGVPIYDTFSAMRLVDGFVLSRRGDDEILPSTDTEEVDNAEGGLVLSPSSGITEWVGVIDLKSLYPSSIITANISKEMMTDDNDEADVIVPWMPAKEDDFGGTIKREHLEFDAKKGQGLKLDDEGIMPKYLKLLFSEREDMKDNRNRYDPDTPMYQVWDHKQRAVKVIMNSFFGVSNNKYYRLSSPELGDTITGLSRFILWTGVEICEELGYEVLYGDTDSVMVSLADPEEFEDLSERETMEKVVERGKEVERRINEEIGRAADDIGLGDDHPFIDLSELPHNLPEDENHAWAFEFEKLFRRFFQYNKKKRYAGGCVWKEGKYMKDENGNIVPVPNITGMESERSDSPELTEEAQPEVIKKILNAEGFDEVSAYIKDLCDRIRSQDIELRKIAKPGTINDPIHSYSSPTLSVRASIYSNEHLGYDWSHGDQPWIYYIKKTPAMKPNTDVLALEWWDDIPDGFDLDSEKHIEKTLDRPLRPILEEVGWDFDELAAGAQTEGVELEDSNNSNPFAGGSDDDDGDDGSGGVLSW
ncbi:DNA polymerase elongation subunit (family B) [Halovirus HCTV-5]|uniref:DNA polymerase elongation subunit (family B) n=1 Tax=Halovirus HCTV-5 TaxID=1273748 RepID=UPI0003348F74|nr:DNA polymerase elongation subunit (family B) [Halovirus HCTV-5]AGM11697.1 DNA polymerase elongation subunit (family B) [Halovirus HCTV-5]